MNELYNHTIEFRGRIYRYDPDFDHFYPVREELTTWDRWSWIVATVVLALIIWAIEWACGGRVCF